MKKSTLGFTLFISGAALGIFASQKNCLIALILRGEMNFWTGIEILAGIVAIAGLIIFLTSPNKKSYAKLN